MATGDVTALLAAARGGDPCAVSAAFGLLYGELRKLARAKLRVHQTTTLLDTTSLVHECYLRFASQGRMQLADRAHFLAYAARVMRSVIVDFARECMAERRGGGLANLTLDTLLKESLADAGRDLLKLDDALADLEQVNARLASIVEMRYFAGYSEREIAEALGVSERTVKRDWRKARLLLRAALA